jgi:hypothetical protein
MDRWDWERTAILITRLAIGYFGTGGMAERFKAAVLKTVDGETRPGVRIPLPPPENKGLSELWAAGSVLRRQATACKWELHFWFLTPFLDLRSP